MKWNKLYWLKREVKQIQAEIDSLTVLSAVDMSGTPHSNSVTSPVEIYHAKKAKLEAERDKAQAKVDAEAERLREMLNSIEDAEIRVLARARYLECKTWEVIGDENHMDRRTASRKLEKYFGKDDTQ